MTEFESVFIDTSLFICLIEKNPEFSSAVERFIAEQFSNEALFITSVISVSEFQVGPKRKNQTKPIEDFDLLMDKFQFAIFNITSEIANLASTLRAKYLFLKGLDSFQIALAIDHRCKIFFTNDSELK